MDGHEESAALDRMRRLAQATFRDANVRAHPDLSRAARNLWLATALRKVPARLEREIVDCLDLVIALAHRSATGFEIDEACRRAENLVAVVAVAQANGPQGTSTGGGRAA